MQQYSGLSFYICILKCCLSLWILFGNGLTVVITARSVTNVSPTHVAIGYSALSDFMLGLTLWFHLTTYLTQGYKHWRNWCIFAAFVDCFSYTEYHCNYADSCRKMLLHYKVELVQKQRHCCETKAGSWSQLLLHFVDVNNLHHSW